MNKELTRPLFFTIQLDDETKKFIKQECKEVIIKYKKENQVSSFKWNMNLCYIGNVKITEIEKVKSILTGLNSFDSFQVVLNKLDVFTSRDKARILWVGSEENEQLNSVSEYIRSELKKINISFDDKPFIGHITLTRFRGTKDMSHSKVLGNLKNQHQFCVEKITLFESVSPQQPYNEIASTKLK